MAEGREAPVAPEMAETMEISSEERGRATRPPPLPIANERWEPAEGEARVGGGEDG